jgi:hypothetical protein
MALMASRVWFVTGTSAFRPITWEEWLENFDSHQCAFVYDESEEPLSSRYRIVKFEDWKAFLQANYAE